MEDDKEHINITAGTNVADAPELSRTGGRLRWKRAQGTDLFTQELSNLKTGVGHYAAEVLLLFCFGLTSVFIVFGVFVMTICQFVCD